MPQVFEVTPISGVARWILPGLAALMLLLAVGFGWLYVRGRNVSLRLDASGVTFDAPLYGRTIRRTDLIIDACKVVDLSREPELEPSWRTNGVGLPGYRLGWFKLKSGAKALVYLTHGPRAVYLPTNKGYVLLVGLKDPKSFVVALGSARDG